MAINLKTLKKSYEEKFKEDLSRIGIKTFGQEAIKLHLPYISFSFLGYIIMKDLNYPEIEEHYFLGFRIK